MPQNKPPESAPEHRPWQRPPRLLWQVMWRQISQKVLRWLGLQPIDRRRFSLDGELGQIIEQLAAYEQRPPDEVAAGLVEAGLVQRDLQSDTWQRWRSLSPRQQQVATLVCRGLTTRQIAAQLFITEDTVKAHVRGVLIKFNLHSRSELRLLLGEDWEKGR